MDIRHTSVNGHQTEACEWTSDRSLWMSIRQKPVNGHQPEVSEWTSDRSLWMGIRHPHTYSWHYSQYRWFQQKHVSTVICWEHHNMYMTTGLFLYTSTWQQVFFILCYMTTGHLYILVHDNMSSLYIGTWQQVIFIHWYMTTDLLYTLVHDNRSSLYTGTWQQVIFIH